MNAPIIVVVYTLSNTSPQTSSSKQYRKMFLLLAVVTFSSVCSISSGSMAITVTFQSLFLASPITPSKLKKAAKIISVVRICVVVLLFKTAHFLFMFCMPLGTVHKHLLMGLMQIYVSFKSFDSREGVGP